MRIVHGWVGGWLVHCLCSASDFAASARACVIGRVCVRTLPVVCRCLHGAWTAASRSAQQQTRAHFAARDHPEWARRVSRWIPPTFVSVAFRATEFASSFPSPFWRYRLNLH